MKDKIWVLQLSVKIKAHSSTMTFCRRLAYRDSHDNAAGVAGAVAVIARWMRVADALPI